MVYYLREFLCCLLYLWCRLTKPLPQFSSIYFHNPSPWLFEVILKWYKKHNYRIISLAELIECLEKRRRPNERLAFISFDDGWRSNSALVPLCEEYGAPITIFVATEPLVSGNFWWEFVEKSKGEVSTKSLKQKPEDEFFFEIRKIKRDVKLTRSALTVDELKSLSLNPLVTIQSHTVNHPILTNLSNSSLFWELSESKNDLETIVGDKVDVFSYPNGNVGLREIEALKKTGYRYAFTTQSLDFSLEQFDPYLLPRMAMNTNGGKFDNLAKLTGIWYKIKHHD